MKKEFIFEKRPKASNDKKGMLSYPACEEIKNKILTVVCISIILKCLKYRHPM